MITDHKREAARLNGAKSRGPVTSAGKARSSQNAVIHGLLSNTVLLPGESEQQFQQLLDSLIATYRPQTDAEAKLVEQIAAVTWFQLRLLGIETQTLATRMELQAQALDAQVLDPSPSRRIALAYAELADTSRVPANLDRHSTRLGRQLDRLHHQLLRLQALRNNDPGSGSDQPHSGSCLLSSDSSPDSCLPSPDSSPDKFPNEPTGEQPVQNQPLQDGPESLGVDDATSICLPGPTSLPPVAPTAPPRRPSPDTGMVSFPQKGMP
ncbi:MAG: hypothetical protein IT168_12085 [Bryobacterales bacterium]|nr:hypothetical protein [Bryobacterales bacterium]